MLSCNIQAMFELISNAYSIDPTVRSRFYTACSNSIVNAGQTIYNVRQEITQNFQGGNYMLKKSVSVIMALMIALSVFTVAPLTASAEEIQTAG